MIRFSARSHLGPIAMITCVIAAIAISSEGGEQRGREPRGETPDNSRTFLATLYVSDPITSSVNLSDGSDGGAIQDFMAKNHSNDLVLGSYNPGEFSVGMEGGKRGYIVDLGTRNDLKKRYGYTETVGAGQGFASIRRVKGEVQILRNHSDQTHQPLREASALSQARDHAPVLNDHVYLIRITDGSDPKYELLVKLLVVAHTPGVAVTVRWQVL